jgi:hypothetical protein
MLIVERYLKKLKRAGGVVQVAECLPSKYKELSTNPSTSKKTRKKRKEFKHIIFNFTLQSARTRKRTILMTRFPAAEFQTSVL